jgi:multiple sugar transport system substrate-binding protein
MDITRYNDSMIATIKQYAPNGELFAIPWSHLPMSLYYNKDIFDKFGVPYPKDGMTWDDVADLARKLSREDGGVKYRGFDMVRRLVMQLNQLSLAYVDPKTEKAIVNTDQWKNYFNTFVKIYTVPGNEPIGSDSTTAFFKDQTVAMDVTYGNFPATSNETQLKAWEHIDLVTMPTFKEAPGVGNQYSGASMAVSKTSKYKDQALLMIAAATSDEAEKAGAQIVRYPTIKCKAVLDEFGKGTPLLVSKNMQSLQKLKVAPTLMSTEYDDLAQAIMRTTFEDIAFGKVDVVTALRNAEEAINKKIAEEKAKK